MSSRTRRLVLLVSAPIVVFVLVGGFLSQVIAREDTYQHLKVFDDVVGLITKNYVEEVDIDRVMGGAMLGLADSLDPDSTYLTPEQVAVVEEDEALPAGDVGLDFTRQYYLRIIAARDGSPAARAGLRTGDYVRAIDGEATRFMSVFEGMRALRGAPGSSVTLTVLRGNANDPREITLTRDALPAPDVTVRMAAPGVGYLRVAEINERTVEQVRARAADLARTGASSLIVDVRRVSGGEPGTGVELARLFVANGTLARREVKGAEPELLTAGSNGGRIMLPTTLLIDNGTSGAAEVFAAALVDNSRAELVGERTIGRAAEQNLIKLPDGAGLWLTTTHYSRPDGTRLHGQGLEPNVPVDQPIVEFGQTPPTTDPILDAALERIAQKRAA
jgi:carboxyl-terminal processing protease